MEEIIQACKKGDFHYVQSHLHLLPQKESMKRSPECVAAVKGHWSIVELLLQEQSGL
jgi:hypothetical protein